MKRFPVDLRYKHGLTNTVSLCYRHAGAEVYISNLAKYKLLHKESKKYEGYRLTYLGYDFLAIHSLVKKGVINSVGRQIGVGKESDVFEVSVFNTISKTGRSKMMSCRVVCHV